MSKRKSESDLIKCYASNKKPHMRKLIHLPEGEDYSFQGHTGECRGDATSIESLVVHHVDDCMFYGCTRLNSLTLPEGCNLADCDYNFRDCAGLNIIKSLTLHPGSKVGDFSFQGCTGIEELIISEGCVFGSNSFEGCTRLKTLIISKGCVLGERTFAGCGITSLTLPYGCRLGDRTFENCVNIKSLVIHSGCQLKFFTFKGCTGITSLTIMSGCKLGYATFIDCTGITSLIIEEGCQVGNRTFEGCVNINSITISKGCHFYVNPKDNPETFMYCVNLKHLVIASDVFENYKLQLRCPPKLIEVVIENFVGIPVLRNYKYYDESVKSKIIFQSDTDSIDFIMFNADNNCVELEDLNTLSLMTEFLIGVNIY